MIDNIQTAAVEANGIITHMATPMGQQEAQLTRGIPWATLQWYANSVPPVDQWACYIVIVNKAGPPVMACFPANTHAVTITHNLKNGILALCTPMGINSMPTLREEYTGMRFTRGHISTLERLG